MFGRARAAGIYACGTDMLWPALWTGYRCRANGVIGVRLVWLMVQAKWLERTDEHQ